VRAATIITGAALAAALAPGAAGAAVADPQYGAAPVAPRPAVTPKPKPKPKPKPAPAVAPRAIAAAPTPTLAWTARVLMQVPMRRAPLRGAARRGVLSPYAPHDAGPQHLLVVGARATRRDGVWYRLLLPSRPNGASAWVPASAVKVTPTPWRVTVSIARRQATLRRAGRVVRTWTVAVGTAANPTPKGRFALSEVIPQPDPRGFYGPFILTLTAHSTTLSDFDGGGGRVALHGTSRPDLLGQAVSHGCVRLPNAAARTIGRLVPPGSPVDVTA
jgi:lipoprotein-anchoring transpeptidase ErfK/SrfK